MSSAVRVLIVSRSPAYALGLASFIGQAPLDPVVAHTVDQALRRVFEGAPALAIVDWQVADASGLELAGELRRRSPGTRILFAVENESTLGGAVTGASCVLHTWTREAVINAVVEALAGFGRADQAFSSSLNALAAQTGHQAESPLTDQERVVLRLMRQQLTYKEIALRLGVSWHTVRTHAQSILRKLGIHSRRDLDAWDARLGSPAGSPQDHNGLAPHGGANKPAPVRLAG